MKPRTLTKPEILNQEYVSNRHVILTETGLSFDNYNNLWLDAGKMFLEDMYPPSDPQFREYYHRFYNQRGFWKWFLKKWHDRERKLLTEVRDCDVKLTAEVYKDSMLAIAYSPFLEENFYDFIGELQTVL